MEEKAKGIFLKKIVINGFSVTELPTGELILSPRGALEPAEITLQEKEPNVWSVVDARGAYRKFARGKNREAFETYITNWATQALLEALG